MVRVLVVILAVVVLMWVALGQPLTAVGTRMDPSGMLSVWAPSASFTPTAWVYLPLVIGQGRAARRVNVPHFDGDVPFEEMAIFWFGQVNSTDNYADVRMGYNDQELFVNVTIFDRLLWYDTSPSPADLITWDAVTLDLNLPGNVGDAPGPGSYRFDAQLNDGQANAPRTPWQAAYRGTGSGWSLSSIPFTTTSGYRWESSSVGGANNGKNNRGWTVNYSIPFKNLGMSGAPVQGTTWGMAVILHDRDDAGGTPIADKTWPETVNMNKPSTWGQLRVGLPVFTPPAATSRGSVTIRHKLNGATVADAAVGGTTPNLCPGDSSYVWNQWGVDNYAGQADFNVQNQSDLADWPCFAKYYVTFPLSMVPTGKTIVSATLTLHQSGNSGTFGDPDPGNRPWPSLIQVFTVAEDWTESTLTWNNAPLAMENVSRAWVDPVTGCGTPAVPWPCFARTWDVSYAVAQAYATGQPLRLAMYEADSHYHSGKYFTSSDTEDWNATGRPALTVTWGTSP